MFRIRSVVRKDRSRLVAVGLFSLPESSATATEHARNARNRQLRSTRNRLRLRPVAGFLPVQQLDFETLVMHIPGEKNGGSVGKGGNCAIGLPTLNRSTLNSGGVAEATGLTFHATALYFSTCVTWS